MTCHSYPHRHVANNSTSNINVRANSIFVVLSRRLGWFEGRLSLGRLTGIAVQPLINVVFPKGLFAIIHFRHAKAAFQALLDLGLLEFEEVEPVAFQELAARRVLWQM
jgi:hypothetical protein